MADELENTAAAAEADVDNFAPTPDELAALNSSDPAPAAVPPLPTGGEGRGEGAALATPAQPASVPPELSQLGFKDAAGAANFIAQQSTALDQLRAEIAELKKMGLSTAQATQVATSQPAKPAFQMPKSIREINPAKYGAMTDGQLKEVGGIEYASELLLWNMQHNPDFKGQFKKYDEFIDGFQKKEQTYEQQTQAERHRAAIENHVDTMEATFWQANEQLKPGTAPRQALDAFMQKNAKIILNNVIADKTFNPFEWAKSALGEQLVSTQRAATATSRGKLTNALAQTARPGMTAPTTPAGGATDDEQMRHEILAAGGTAADADAAINAMQRGNF